MLKDAQGMPELGWRKMLETRWNQDARGCLKHTRTEMLEDARDTLEWRRMLETHGDAGGCSRDTRAGMAGDAQGTLGCRRMLEAEEAGGGSGAHARAGDAGDTAGPGGAGTALGTLGLALSPLGLILPPHRCPIAPHLTHSTWGRTLGGHGDGPHRHTDWGQGCSRRIGQDGDT